MSVAWCLIHFFWMMPEEIFEELLMDFSKATSSETHSLKCTHIIIMNLAQFSHFNRIIFFSISLSRFNVFIKNLHMEFLTNVWIQIKTRKKIIARFDYNVHLVMKNLK